jgi:hypothetical protein
MMRWIGLSVVMGLLLIQCTPDISDETDSIAQYAELNGISFEYKEDSIYIDILDRGSLDTMAQFSISRRIPRWYCI